MWEILPRRTDLRREGDPVTEFDKLTLIERDVQASTWTVEGPASALAEFTLGTGAILVRDGEPIVSGSVHTIDGGGLVDDSGRSTHTRTCAFVDDSWHLWTRLCYPDPAHVLTSTPSLFAVSHDKRTGNREDLILAYIAANLGPAAPQAVRRLTSLVMPTSLDRGGTTTVEARMDVLGDLVAELAEAANLRVRIMHDESTGTPKLALTITPSLDRSADVVFGPPESVRATGALRSWGYGISVPKVTDAITFAGGDLEMRYAAAFGDATALAVTGHRVEQLVDAGQTEDIAVVNDAAARALQEGAAPMSIEFKIATGGDLVPRVDFWVGDRVGVEIPDLPNVTDNRLREAMTTVTAQGEELELVVGSGNATLTDTPEVLRADEALKRIRNIERGK